MGTLYLPIKHLHVTMVALSGLLFLVRGLAVLAGKAWATRPALNRTTQVVDTVLLASAIALAVMLGQYPFVHGWLTVKVLLLVAYIVLGVFALRRGRTTAVRSACFVAALAVYATIIGVARQHHPLGWFA